jgi:glycerophosphoryl diester phosphodiesterase
MLKATGKPLLLGHRGARRAAPENTLAAFELALAHGCDGFEFDVRATADGVPVVCHDPEIANLAVDRCSFVQLAARCPDLPDLNKVLAQFASRAYLYIELKVTGLENAVRAALSRHPPQHGYVVASFLPEAITSVYERDRSIPLGLISSRSNHLSLWRSLPIAILMPQDRLVSLQLLREVHEAGKQVFVWTVNEAQQMRALAAAGIDGILSDDTELLGNVLGSVKPDES